MIRGLLVPRRPLVLVLGLLLLGTGAASASYTDIDVARCIVLAGANPTEAHPVVGARIKQAVLRGARLVVIDPRRTAMGENPLKLDSKAPKISFEDYAYKETRWKMLTKSKPDDCQVCPAQHGYTGAA